MKKKKNILIIKFYSLNKTNNNFWLIYSSNNSIYVNNINISENINELFLSINLISINIKEFSFCYINMDNENNLLIADEKTKKILLIKSEIQYIDIECPYENGKDIEIFMDDDKRYFLIVSGNGLNNYTKSYLIFNKKYYQIYRKENHYLLKNINRKFYRLYSSI